jgi:hypothetical protein
MLFKRCENFNIARLRHTQIKSQERVSSNKMKKDEKNICISNFGANHIESPTE